ncbi:hypothetical protein GGF38_006229, partial [Coemansia sp. RSA 25]
MAEPRIDVLSVLEAELEALHPQARVYQQRTKTPVFFRVAKTKVLRSTKAEIASLKAPTAATTAATTATKKDNIIQLAAAYLGLLSVYAWSAWSYVLYGPRNAAWDFRTHYIRDLLMYMLAHQADAGIQLMIKLTNGVWPELTTAMQRVPQGFASRIIIPAYPLGSLPPC